MKSKYFCSQHFISSFRVLSILNKCLTCGAILGLIAIFFRRGTADINCWTLIAILHPSNVRWVRIKIVCILTEPASCLWWKGALNTDQELFFLKRTNLCIKDDVFIKKDHLSWNISTVFPSHIYYDFHTLQQT